MVITSNNSPHTRRFMAINFRIFQFTGCLKRLLKPTKNEKDIAYGFRDIDSRKYVGCSIVLLWQICFKVKMHCIIKSSQFFSNWFHFLLKKLLVFINLPWEHLRFNYSYSKWKDATEYCPISITLLTTRILCDLRK